jgi:ribonucleoside-diphosphate reductase alpha chain
VPCTDAYQNQLMERKTHMSAILVRSRDGSLEPVREDKINQVLEQACQGLEGVSWSDIALGCQVTWYSGISTEEIDESTILSARSLIEQHPNYSYVAARLILKVLYQQVFGASNVRMNNIQNLYQQEFENYIQSSVSLNLLDERLLTFNLKKLAQAIDSSADQHFQFQGIQILKDRYLIRSRDQSIMELPQWMWMRVSMGLALLEPQKEEKAIEFYQLIKEFYYMPSTPTLFSAGTIHPQLSSCFLNTVDDSIEGIFKAYTDNARLSKWAGGIGTDWTPIRATGSLIQGTNGQSQGLIPWLRIDNDVALAVNQGGKRKGAHCAYLETWHLDIEDFLDLRKNVGDERRRTHDINTANWIPDLFMKRVQEDGHWTLFSPEQVPELHELFGSAFETAYLQRELEYEQGRITGKRIEAKSLWRKMLTMLFETGHPWITFKDACNIRSPQDHAGVVHSSNLCTEITLNTSLNETAVCNLGSVNLARHIENEQIHYEKLARTIQTAVRMLDNVIDINYYPTAEAKNANLRHRAIGLGMMGYQDMLYQLDIPFASEAHIQLADELTERFSYEAILASCKLAEERGQYSSFHGSKWDRGIFPLDTIELLEQERQSPILCDRNHRLNWDTLKAAVKQHGLRNSNIMAVAPTATISNIIGTTPCIEPTFKNLYVTSNLSGEFTVINQWLVRDLEQRDLWSSDMVASLKAVDGRLSALSNMPDDLKRKYPDVFEIDQHWLIRAAVARGKWIDQSQSLNLFIDKPSGKLMNELYTTAWSMGLKTTYYLRSLAISQVEKSTVDPGQFGKTHLRTVEQEIQQPVACMIDNPECEACQ